jgi:hypothetical protein
MTEERVNKLRTVETTIDGSSQMYLFWSLLNDHQCGMRCEEDWSSHCLFQSIIPA